MDLPIRFNSMKLTDATVMARMGSSTSNLDPSDSERHWVHAKYRCNSTIDFLSNETSEETRMAGKQ